MRSGNFSDAQLLDGLISQDQRILKEYYVKYFQSIRHYVISNNGNDEDARDLFQDTLLVIFQKVRTGDFKLTSALGTYIYSVSRLIWLKELGKRRSMPWQSIENLDYVDIDADVIYLNEKNERLLFFQKCFDMLSENCKKVLILFIEGHSIAEITKIMGFNSDQHTKNRRYRCKLSLIKSIKENYDFYPIR